MLASGGAKCWGNGSYGSLGDNRWGSYNPEPVSVRWLVYPGPGGALPFMLVPDRCP